MVLALGVGSRVTTYCVFLSMSEDLAQPYCYGIELCDFGKLLKNPLIVVSFELFCYPRGIS